MNNPIGIIDSGVGGLSVWREIIALLPHESTIYLADQKNVPYGTKDPEEIYKLAKRLVAFLLSSHVKIIVIACNTITVTSIKRLREEYPQVPIIGTVPVVKKAVEITKNGRIGILSTISTAESEYQKQLIKKYAENMHVINIGCDKLVPLVEQGIINGRSVEEAVALDIGEFKKNKIDTLALGCTHFPFIRSVLHKLLGEDVQLLDSGSAIARQVKRILEHNVSLADTLGGSHLFFTTGNAENFKNVAKKLLGSTITTEIREIEI